LPVINGPFRVCYFITFRFDETWNVSSKRYAYRKATLPLSAVSVTAGKNVKSEVFVIRQKRLKVKNVNATIRTYA